MDPSLLILFLGVLYILVFGGLSFLRREGLSSQFAVESLAVTIGISGISYFLRTTITPLVFLVILYLFTMRVRLLVDVSNYFAQKRHFSQAESLYRLAEQLWPDRSSRLILLVNQGALQLQKGELDQAIGTFQQIMAENEQGNLGIKHEAAAHYNLGVAYLRKKLDAQARREFNAVLDTWPASEYARQAEKALERYRMRSVISTAGDSTDQAPD